MTVTLIRRLLVRRRIPSDEAHHATSIRVLCAAGGLHGGSRSARRRDHRAAGEQPSSAEPQMWTARKGYRAVCPGSFLVWAWGGPCAAPWRREYVCQATTVWRSACRHRTLEER